MPEIQITPREFVDGYVRPMANQLGGPAPGAVDALVAALGVAFNLDQQIEFLIPNPFPAPPTGDGSGQFGGDQSLLPQLPALQPIDPTEVLRAVAKAVRDAEEVLNGQNLAIEVASAEISLVVQVGSVAGGNATLRLSIGPTPHP